MLYPVELQVQNCGAASPFCPGFSRFSVSRDYYTYPSGIMVAESGLAPPRPFGHQGMNLATNYWYSPHQKLVPAAGIAPASEDLMKIPGSLTQPAYLNVVTLTS